MRELAEWADDKGCRYAQLICRRQRYHLSSARDHSTLHIRLFQISGADPEFRMQAAYPQKAQIGPNIAESLHGRCTDSHHFMLVKFPSNHDQLNLWMFRQGNCNWRTVRNYRGAQISWQVLCHLQGRGAAIQDNHLVLSNELDGCLCNSNLRFCCLFLAHSETRGSR